MRILNIAFGFILVGNAMAEPRGLSDIYQLAVANDPSLRAQIAVRDASEALKSNPRRTRFECECKCVSKRNAEPQK